MKFLALLLLSCLLALPAAAQRIVISGQVVEATNGEPVPFASVFIPRTSFGVTADADGKFKLAVTGSPDSLAASAMGFATQRRRLSDAAVQSVLFRMKTGGVALGEVFVSSRQPENPAFRILREVQRHKPENERLGLKAAEYDSYNRIETSLIDLPKSLANRKLIKDIRALAVRQGAAAAADADAPLPIFASEVSSRVYQRNAPLRRREDLQHRQMRGAGPREGSVLSQMLGSNFQNFDFYPNWQNVLGKDFISPIAEGGRLTYDYELQDSVFVGKDFCYKIAVTPKRSHDLAFKGTIWITAEGYALRRADLVASPEANINFVNDLRVYQDLTSPADGPGLPTRTKLVLSVRPYEKQAAMLVRFTTVSSNFVRNQVHGEPGFYDQPIVSSLMEPVEGATGLLSGLPQSGTGGYFDQHRPDTLSLSERQTFAVLDSAKQLPSVRNVLDWVELLVNGYKRVGKFDVGPVSTLYARNDFEGSRFRLGFRTTPLISRNWLAQGYVAYGTKDGRVKYGIRTSYVAERRHWTVFTGEFRHDVEQAALLDNDFLDNNSLFVAASRWGRFRQGKPVLRDLTALSMQRDLFHGFTQTLTLRYQSINPLFEFHRRSTNGPGGQPPTSEPGTNMLQLSELVSESRYAPDENLVQSENRRRVVGLKRLPVFSFRYTLGAIDWNEGRFMYHKFNLAISHSVSVGQLGRLTYRAEGNYIPTALPYIILKTPLGNQTPFYNANAFNLMNYFEFVTDRSASLRFDHHFEGLFVNSIPGIRALNLRLVATGNVLYGKLSDRARRANLNTSDLPGPISIPYVEVGYGVENIFKFIRIDFIHRLTYRDASNTSNFGIRVGAQFRL